MADILTTPLGSRVMLPTYGSDLYKYIDRGITKALTLDIAAEVIRALTLWEPRIKVEQVLVDTARAVKGKLGVIIRYVPTGSKDTQEMTL